MANITKLDALRAGTRMVGKQANTIYEQSLSSGNENPKMKVLASLLIDEAFSERFLFTPNPRAAQALFAENGLSLSSAEVAGVAQRIKEVALHLIDNSDELNEPELDLVAGGSAGLLGNDLFFSPANDWPFCTL